MLLAEPQKEVLFMRKRMQNIWGGTTLLCSALVAASAFAEASGAGGSDLALGFASPPASAKPQVWWHWMAGNVSREGITADLEAMADAGIGGAIL